jgi:hypothetical protein
MGIEPTSEAWEACRKTPNRRIWGSVAFPLARPAHPIPVNKILSRAMSLPSARLCISFSIKLPS